MIEGCLDGVLGQPHQLGVGTACSEDLCIARGDHAPPLTLERASHNSRATSSLATSHDLIYELDQVVI